MDDADKIILRLRRVTFEEAQQLFADKFSDQLDPSIQKPCSQGLYSEFLESIGWTRDEFIQTMLDLLRNKD